MRNIQTTKYNMFVSTVGVGSDGVARIVLQPNPSLDIFDMAFQEAMGRGTSDIDWKTITATTTDLPISAPDSEVHEYIAQAWRGLRNALEEIEDTSAVAQLLPIPAIPLPLEDEPESDDEDDDYDDWDDDYDDDDEPDEYDDDDDDDDEESLLRIFDGTAQALDNLFGDDE